MGQKTPLDRVASYYPMIDAGRVTAILNLFTDNATYAREGRKPLVGLAAIKHFYHFDRGIYGKHRLKGTPQSCILPNNQGTLVTAEGVFEGHRRRTREPVNVTFQDVWLFPKQSDKASFRQSFIQLAQGEEPI